MSRKKLVLNVGTDPTKNPRPALKALSLAEMANRTGLDVEVQFGGDAVRAAFMDQLDTTDDGRELAIKLEDLSSRPYEVTL
ncbi:MAG: hypothetical protein LC775_13905 [Acidobacteria bacterium]|nr:hypothetical protein [Acidobacteriota bacterium]